MSASHIGIVFSEEHKRRISEAKCGKPRPDMIGNQFARRMKHTEEWKQARREAMLKFYRYKDWELCLL